MGSNPISEPSAERENHGSYRVSGPKPPPPGPENTPTSATGTVDVALELLKDMKNRILGVELLWIRVKQLDQRLDFVETSFSRLNGRVSVALRRRPQQARTDVVAPTSQHEYSDAELIEVAQEIAKRHHSVQKSSAQQPAQLTTTSQISPEQSPES